MSAVWRAVFATFCFSFCVNAQMRTLAVYQSAAQHIDSITLHELQKEVQRVLDPAAIHVAWRQTSERGMAEQLDKLAVASFEGDCSVAELPPLFPTSRLAGMLADTVVGKDGQVQPFFRVDCSRIIRNLRPSLDRLNVPMRSVMVGRALGRVVAHEIYHIVAETAVHAEAGVAKPSFSPEDLIAERFDFTAISLERLRPARLSSRLGN
jgi:hypothetical protein